MFHVFWDPTPTNMENSPYLPHVSGKIPWKAIKSEDPKCWCPNFGHFMALGLEQSYAMVLVNVYEG